MERYIVTVLPGGRITIPAPVRKSLNLNPGDTLIWWWEGREVHFRKAEPNEVSSLNNRSITAEVSSSDVTGASEEE